MMMQFPMIVIWAAVIVALLIINQWAGNRQMPIINRVNRRVWVVHDGHRPVLIGVIE